MPDGDAGGIRAQGPLTLIGVVISNNFAYGSGAGIWTNAAFSIADSVVQKNMTWRGDGGGIWASQSGSLVKRAP